MKKQRNYDKKVKQTRILLSDYLLLKRFAAGAGVSMSEALHKLIIGLKPEPKPEPEPVTQPVSQSVHGLTPSVAFKLKPIESDGVTFKPKFIPDNNDIGVKLKSIQ
ncbi:hypothetical protein ES708_26709 [subsurface metagenome]